MTTTTKENELDVNSLAELLRGLEGDAHGFSGLDGITEELSQIKRTEKRMLLLRETLSGPSINWDDVCLNVWKTEEEANQNRFPFLQGDLIKTNRVLRPGHARSTGDLNTWMVLSSTCDHAK
jgi:hypothetical protein